VAGKVTTLPAGTELAKESIDSGRAMTKLRTFIQESNA
jgi:anthranilate phosphoribosyltransferase